MKTAELARAFEVSHGKNFRLKHVNPADTGRIKSKEHAQVALQEGLEQLTRLQEKLYAQGRWALLLIFQAMDAAGKDSAIKHVMSGVNPRDASVFLQSPLHQELKHDFLWRTTCCLPERGRIGIFNRSYYEECWC